MLLPRVRLCVSVFSWCDLQNPNAASVVALGTLAQWSDNDLLTTPVGQVCGKLARSGRRGGVTVLP